MTDRAKLLSQGGNQLVELPKPYQFPGYDEVMISQDGDAVVLRAGKRTWSPQFHKLAGSAADFSYPDEPGERPSGK